MAQHHPTSVPAVTKQIPSYLKLVTDTTHDALARVSEDLAAIHDLGRAFDQATGWRLEVAAGSAPNGNSNLMWSAPVNPGVGNSPGHIRLISGSSRSSDAPRLPLEQAGLLAGAIGKLWSELAATRGALAQREAELAANVPISVREGDDGPSLSERLEAVLRGGAEAVGCHAAALYLLDPGTTELKLRSCWGLPHKRLADAPRPLRGSLGDLEALLGHAVVLTDNQLFDHWKVPERDFSSAVCVPVSSATIPLGTLWFFCHAPRDFSDPQTNILEVVAGRIVGDLERETLVDEALVAREQIKQLNVMEGTQRDRLPATSPVIDGWDIAGHAFHAGTVGGTFYDWFTLEDGSLAVLAGDSLAHGMQGALTASALRAAARACGPQQGQPHRLLEKSNGILWTGSAGDEGAGLFQAIFTPQGRACTFAAAGPLRVLSIKGDEPTLLSGPNTPLGWEEAMRLDDQRHELAKNELLVIYGTSFLTDCDELTLQTLDDHLALNLEAVIKSSARTLAEVADDTLRTHPGLAAADRVVLVVKRR